MTRKLFTTAIAALALVTMLDAPAYAQHGRRGGSVVTGHAVRGGPGPSRVYGPGYRAPYYRGYRYGYPYYRYGYPYYGGFNLFFGYGYPYGYPYGYYGSGWGYPYGAYPYGLYGAYGYPGYYGYGYGGYGYGYAYGHDPYGSVKITDAPKDAQVFVDGYYAGVVGDFDGAFHHLDLEPGPHKIEVRAPGLETSSFEVNVTPGHTITFHARPRLPQP